MWPWEHLALAYLLYSLYANVGGDPPTTRAVLAVAVGSQLPDLVDKPLAWTLEVVPTGYAIGHSIFVAPLACLGAYAAARRYGDARAGIAFSLAYLSHLGSDALYPLVLGRGVEPRAVLWPLASPPPGRAVGGFADHFLLYFARYLRQLAAGEPTPYLLLQVGLGTAVLALWLRDGAPVVADVLRALSTRLAR